ncbi:MAG: diacylglycerol kinase family protein [Bdellovibrionota bacterium]
MSQSKTFLIINPKAKKRHHKKFQELLKELNASGTPYDQAESKDAEDITTLCKTALDAGYTNILPIGGDGTLSLCIQAFMHKQKNLYPDAAITPKPFGTGNDFHAAFKTKGQTTVSLGLFQTVDGTDHYFVNSFSAGITPSLIQSYAGAPVRSYLLATLKTLLTYKSQTIHINHIKRPTLLFLITKGPYVGGGMRLSKESDHISSKTKVIWIPKLSFQTLIKNLHRLYKGGVESLNEVESYDFEPLTLTLPEESNEIEADGEIYTVKKQVPITIIPSCIRIFH